MPWYVLAFWMLPNHKYPGEHHSNYDQERGRDLQPQDSLSLDHVDARQVGPTRLELFDKMVKRARRRAVVPRHGRELGHHPVSHLENAGRGNGTARQQRRMLEAPLVLDAAVHVVCRRIT